MKRKIAVQRTAHYSILGDPDAEIKELWIVCHGYAQLAETFIENFKCLETPGRVIIAPEGLSRFYWGGFTGPVVASWMTSGDRLDEIEDYCNWLDTLYQEYQSNFSPQIKITLLGFSQGTATVMRWVHARQPKIDRLILWAGTTPEDIDYTSLSEYFVSIKKLYVYGLQDKFITEERLTWQMQFLEEQNLEFEIRTFDGKHKIVEQPLVDVASQAY